MVSWKDGWPQPGEVENGKGGVDENGGQECNFVVVLLIDEHVCSVDVGKRKSKRRMRKERVMVKGKGKRDMVMGMGEE
ncbi:hypothetical protein TSUD_240060 [Trifolium subterraneum]|uniref:Uncharacterized protein n=1 Tax=Trifolium subterraneum TaxID=3900 RepID=A0A2Z6P4D1_TRISU|nr:hypothetical protein TSUD_240060 [Trifolium subterraneum]